MNRFFYNIISFFTAAFFLIFGSFFILLPLFPFLLNTTLQFLKEQTLLIFLFGVCLLLIGIGLSIYLYLVSRHYSYRIISSPHPVDLDQKLIDKALGLYLKDLFPHYSVPYQISFSKNKIFIEANLPSLPMPEQELIVKKVDQELAHLFYKTLGYDREYQIALNFQTEK